jgi:hypothetical protein
LTIIKLLLLAQALQAPSTLPTSYASLTIIRNTIDQVTRNFYWIKQEAQDFGQVLADFEQLYELPNIPKHVVDGRIRFPENMLDLKEGLLIEFR